MFNCTRAPLSNCYAIEINIGREGEAMPQNYEKGIESIGNELIRVKRSPSTKSVTVIPYLNKIQKI